MKKVSPFKTVIKKYYNRVIEKMVHYSPGISLSNKRLKDSFEKVAKYANNVDQRAIIGITSILTQPFIDLRNKNVDEDTRLTSFARTLSKLTIGTCVGIIVRQLCLNVFDKKKKNVNKLFFENSKKNFEAFNRYNKRITLITALGTSLGIIVSIATNILIDAPLTQVSTNFICKKLKTSEKGGQE